MTDDSKKLQCYHASIERVLKGVPLPSDKWVRVLVRDLLLDEVAN